MSREPVLVAAYAFRIAISVPSVFAEGRRFGVGKQDMTPAVYEYFVVETEMLV